MGVQGYLSLYTILLGWQEYDALWRIMASLGFLALPFAFIAYSAFINPFLSMGAKNAGIIGTRRFIYQILAALLVLLFAGVPTVNLNPQVLHFKPTCSKSEETATPGHTGTTYDNLLPIPQDIKVPLLWYVVLAVSNGVTDQAEDTISCPAVNLRSLQSALNLTTIQSPTLKSEVKRYYKECYLPAYQKYVYENDTEQQQGEIKRAQETYGQDDVSWIGSEIFQTVSGFYNVLYAASPVKGFPYNADTPADQIQGQVGAKKWGAPSCLNWWQNQNHGLRTRLYNQIKSEPKKALAELETSGDKQLVQDAAIRAMIEKSTGGSFFNSGYITEESYRHGMNHFFGKWRGTLQSDTIALEEYPKIHIILNALPVIQSILLSAVIMLLAVALPMSGYSLGFCIIATIYLFSITFCSFLWHWVTWIDQFLLHALYGAGEGSLHDSAFKIIKNMAESAVNPEKNLVDMTIAIFYIFIPFIWLLVAGWAGIKMGMGFMNSHGSLGEFGKGGGHDSKNSIGGFGLMKGGKGAASRIIVPPKIG